MKDEFSGLSLVITCIDCNRTTTCYYDDSIIEAYEEAELKGWHDLEDYWICEYCLKK